MCIPEPKQKISLLIHDEVGAAPTAHDHVVGDITNFPTSLPASDVSSWAKAETKPSYAFSEIGSPPTTLSGYGITDATPSSHIGSTGNSHGVATSEVNGFMSTEDKIKLTNIAENANNYLHLILTPSNYYNTNKLIIDLLRIQKRGFGMVRKMLLIRKQ